MRHAAVMHSVRYFGEIKFVVNNKFLHPFNFMQNDKFLNGSALYFGEKIRHVGVIIIKFTAQKIGEIRFWQLFAVMYHLDYYVFNFFN